MRCLIIENNKVVNIAEADDEEFIVAMGWIPTTTIRNGDQIQMGWVRDGTGFAEPPRDLEAEWKFIRMQRDRLLDESDKYVFPDRFKTFSEEMQYKWVTYRQILRDLPANLDDPKNVAWPVFPL
jgi:hypothetical protein